ncbi:hypothetical protein [Streptomyces sp. MP131-18]|uniref:hypothetical protein n=1 Tax=Streptomyces sp. MP131-18 TaxID=1857892 RepID=UPI00209A717B|nr:hypothetical protein [Streptomyces sp. MP131-18]
MAYVRARKNRAGEITSYQVRSGVPRRGEEKNDPAVLGTRVCAELLRQGARDIIEGIPH